MWFLFDSPIAPLVRREFRNARRTILGCAIAVPIAVAVLFLMARDFSYISTCLILTLSGGVLAADSVAADTSERRMDALAVLPIRLPAVWIAKLIMLFACIVLFTLLIPAFDIPISMIKGRKPLTISHDDVVAVYSGYLLFGFFVSSCIAFATAALAHPLGGLFAGFILAVGTWNAGDVAAGYYESLGWKPGFEAAAWYLSSGTLIFGAAGAVVFCYIRGRVVPPARRIASIAIMMVLSFLAGGAAAHAAIRSAAVARPLHPDTRVSQVVPSSDGKFVAMSLLRDPKISANGPHFTCILNVENASLHMLPDFWTYFVDGAFDASGKFTYFANCNGSGKNGNLEVVQLDPRTMEAARRPFDGVDMPTNDPRWGTARSQSTKNQTESRSLRREVTVCFTEHHIQKKYAGYHLFSTTSQNSGAFLLQKPGEFLHLDEQGRLLHHQWIVSEGVLHDKETVLSPGMATHAMVCPDGSRVLLVGKGHTTVVDVATAKVVAGPFDSKKTHYSWMPGDRGGRLLLKTPPAGRRAWIDLEHGTTREVPVDSLADVSRLGETDRIILTNAVGRVWLCDIAEGEPMELALKVAAY